MRARRGFTLIELLAATALFAILGTLLFQVVRGAMDVWAVGERNRELHDRASAVMELIAEDLRSTWPGLSGAGEQDARFLLRYREEDVDGDARIDLRTPVLRFARLCHEQRALGWLREAGDTVGAEGIATLAGEQDPAALRPTGGLAESLYTLAIRPGSSLPSLIRRFRAPLGGDGSLLDPDLLLQPDRMLADGVPVADQVLYFGVELWGPDTTAWDAGADPEQIERPPLTAWDSTRGLVSPDDPTFPYGVGADSLWDGSDDMFPRLARVTLVLDREQGATSSGRVAEAISADAQRLPLQSSTFLRAEENPDHVLVGAEWMRVTSIESGALMVERGARGTVPSAHLAGDRVSVGRRFERIVELPAYRENLNR
ncbi:MAG: PulJ/GspJ family protein [Planctomycetota bacterium]|jgi:prepilin-type N-terminal cleavage/methylation domain-containing protein